MKLNVLNILGWIEKNWYITLGIVVLGYIGILRLQLSSAEDRAHKAGLALDSIQVVNDTTRVIALGVAERRALQSEQARDSIDKKLKRTSKANTTLTLRLKALTITDTSQTNDTTANGTRVASFSGRKIPYTWQVNLRSPRPPTPATMDLKVQLDTANIAVRFQCGEPINGIRPATVLVETPVWLPVVITKPILIPEICNTDPRKQGTSRWTWPIVGGVSGATTGLIVSRDLKGIEEGAAIGTVTGFLFRLLFGGK